MQAKNGCFYKWRWRMLRAVEMKKKKKERKLKQNQTKLYGCTTCTFLSGYWELAFHIWGYKITYNLTCLYFKKKFITWSLCVPEGKNASDVVRKDEQFHISQLPQICCVKSQLSLLLESEPYIARCTNFSCISSCLCSLAGHKLTVKLLAPFRLYQNVDTVHCKSMKAIYFV